MCTATFIPWAGTNSLNSKFFFVNLSSEGSLSLSWGRGSLSLHSCFHLNQLSYVALVRDHSLALFLQSLQLLSAHVILHHFSWSALVNFGALDWSLVAAVDGHNASLVHWNLHGHIVGLGDHGVLIVGLVNDGQGYIHDLVITELFLCLHSVDTRV